VNEVPSTLLAWALEAAELETGPAQVSLVAGDASNRRYFRLEVPGRSLIMLHAPPETEKNPELLRVRETLQQLQVRVPALLAADLARGYLLLEDMGSTLLLSQLSQSTVEQAYGPAYDILAKMARWQPGAESWPAYDRELLTEELSRFPLWFVTELLGYQLNESEQALIARFDEVLLESALSQPQVLVHRDFHSRNLMPQAGGELAVIDFQDAVQGPCTYDLVSLLRDCYIQWPAESVKQWALAYRDRMSTAGLLPDVDDGQYLRWFDLMGLERHIKVLGTFARLYLRDQKDSYLADLPLVIDYVREVLAIYKEEPALAEFSHWFDHTLGPLIAAQPWSKSP
jgi:aminoglycoside/choline kinase family phosphotransferase